MTNNIIKKAYSIFSKYHLHNEVTACYCGVCMTKKFSNYLHSIPLEQISVDTLQGYISCVGIAEGDCNDFKYFFPRILDVIDQEAHLNEFSDFYIFIFGVLERIDYSKWNDDEKEIFVTFFADYWARVKKPGDPNLDDLTIENVKAIVLKSFAL
jgi:hypothetical protein